jgi:hypothetical protein
MKNCPHFYDSLCPYDEPCPDKTPELKRHVRVRRAVEEASELKTN